MLEDLISVELKNVSYSYSVTGKVLNGFNLKVKQGTFVSIIGKTGCGKTTVLKIISGLLKPQTGTVEKAGTSALLLQNPEDQLFAQTVMEDVMYGPRNLGFSEQDSRKMAIEALKTVRISENLYERDPFELSLGQKRMVALAGLLSMNPDILLLDELTSGLDAQSCKNTKAILTDLVKKGKTVINVTHDPVFAYEYSDIVISINDEESGMESDISKLMKSLSDKGLPVKTDIHSADRAIKELRLIIDC